MGLVVSFVPRAAATHPRSQTAGQAAVIIFPGVRYERPAKAQDPRPAMERDGQVPAKPTTSPAH